MKILHTTPMDDGFYMPAEYDLHEGCLMIFPERKDSWKYGAYEARKAFIEIAKAIAKSENVTVAVSDEQYENARMLLPDYIRVIELASDDAWTRDVGPTFVKNKQGELRGIDWGFNAWGGLVDGLYFPWEKDQKLARKFCDMLNVEVYDKRDFILEGGSIHVDGEGTAMVTESCLLSAGRNPDLMKQEIEETLMKYLNVGKVLWLPRGVYHDETNEHVDNICAFCKPGTVVLGWTDDESDPQYALSKACFEYLQGEKDSMGRNLDIIKLPMPAPIYVTQEDCDGLDNFQGVPTRVAGERLAASYVNFYIANNAIVMPGFGDSKDVEAKRILQEIFQDREVIQIDTREILIGGGNIHCLTQQIPQREVKN